MPERITKLQRWIDLIAFLVGRHVPVPFEELVHGVPAYGQKWNDRDEKAKASVRRMFERDKDELRRHGIPLQTVRYSINFGAEEIDGYRIARRDFYLPYLKLVEQATRERNDTGEGPAPGDVSRTRFADPKRIAAVEIARAEAGLALEALRRIADVPSFPLAAEARSAFRKLAFGLEPDAFLPASPVLFVERPETGELLDHLRTLSDALLSRKLVKFRYHGIYRGETSDREVQPFGLLFHHGHWYLIGNDTGRVALRVFRIERMDDVKANGRRPNTPDYDVPADFRLDEWTGREAWELGGEEEAPVRASVRFRWPASLAAQRNRHGRLTLTHEDGGAVREFDVHQVNPFLRWILSLEGDASILDPPELATALRELARDVAAAHAADAGPDDEGDSGPQDGANG